VQEVSSGIDEMEQVTTELIVSGYGRWDSNCPIYQKLEYRFDIWSLKGTNIAINTAVYEEIKLILLC
jgi:hypothetical protein